MGDNPGAIIGAVLIGAIAIGGLFVVLAGGDSAAFTGSMVELAGPVLIIAVVLTGAAALIG